LSAGTNGDSSPSATPPSYPPSAGGGVFAHWCNTIPHHQLVTPRRFDQPWEAAASIALRAGDPRAVDAYNEHRRLYAAHPALIANEVAQLHQRDVSAGRTVAITTNTADTARAINREIQRLEIPPVDRSRWLRGLVGLGLTV
jgi:hypothetical protein